MLAINPAYTSQCACCGHTAKITARRKASLNALRDGLWGERRCERRSQYFKAAGHAVLACGGAVQSARSPDEEEPGTARAAITQ